MTVKKVLTRSSTTKQHEAPGSLLLWPWPLRSTGENLPAEGCGDGPLSLQIVNPGR